MLTDKEKNIRKTILKALTIDEVLSLNIKPIRGEKSAADLTCERLASWCKSSASGDWNLFNKRLQRDKQEINNILNLFSNTEFRLLEQSPPQWAKDAERIFNLLTEKSNLSVQPLLHSDKLHPFQELFSSIIIFADEEVKNKCLNSIDHLNASAIRDCNHALLKQLSDLLSPPLYKDYVGLLKSKTPDRKLLPSDADTNKDQYIQFIQSIRGEPLAQFLLSKPVLLRLLAVTTRQWINTTIELFNRLASDLPEIKSLLGASTDVKVISIKGSGSDLHNAGHSVQILQFDDGSKLVYKPKDLRVDRAWFNLVAFLNREEIPIKLRAAKSIAYDGYGWTEFIEHTSCSDKTQIQDFYRNSGALLSLLHMLASTDMHHENIIASGSNPVVIDLEMLLQASNAEWDCSDPSDLATNIILNKVNDSVLTVGMLPSYTRSPDNQLHDGGGLNAPQGTTITEEWKNINTNGMRWVRVQRKLKPTENIPHIDGAYANVGDYLDDFLEGYVSYSSFIAKPAISKKIIENLQEFSDLPIRKVIRPTRFYYMLLQRLKDHQTMHDGISWSSQAEFLSRLSNWDQDGDVLWPLQKGEREALINLNIPIFTHKSNNTVISDIYGHSTETFAISGLDRAIKRLLNLNQDEIAWQAKVIDVATSFIRNKTLAVRSITSFAKNNSNTPIAKEELAKEVEEIKDLITKFSYADDQSANWMGLDWLGDSDVGSLAPLGDDLYNGTTGVALFLAAYYAQTKHEPTKALALKSLSKVRYQLRSNNAAHWARGLGIGGASGLGSIIYGLSHIATLLDEPILIDDALTITDLFTDELINADQTLDVIAGSAGAIVGLLALYKKTNSTKVLDKAVKCGEHLLNSPRVGEEGYRSWVGLGVGKTPLNGMSHGAAGFEYALRSLSIITGRNDFAYAASECNSFENSHYNEKEHNWPDLRPDADGKPLNKWACQWCHGAVGIGLSRIGSIKSGFHSDLLLKDIENAANGTKNHWPLQIDTLCCGTLGSIEFLSEAGNILNNQTLLSLSEERLSEVINYKKINHTYSWAAGDTSINVGLFRGLSGVGYTILRKLNPSLPNILIWE